MLLRFGTLAGWQFAPSCRNPTRHNISICILRNRVVYTPQVTGQQNDFCSSGGLLLFYNCGVKNGRGARAFPVVAIYRCRHRVNGNFSSGVNEWHCARREPTIKYPTGNRISSVLRVSGDILRVNSPFRYESRVYRNGRYNINNNNNRFA